MSDTQPTFGILSGLWRRRAFRLGLFAAVACGGFLVASCLDRPIHELLHPDKQRDIIKPEMWWMLRSVGYAPMWVAVVAIMLLIDRRPQDDAAEIATQRPNRRGWLILIAVAAAGLAAMIGKILIRRLRPPSWTPWDGQHVFRSWLDRPLSSSGLGLPSSHATVAFAGMFVLCRMFPKASPVFVLLAAGCAFTRLTSRGHFVSDVWVAAILGWVLAWYLSRRLPTWVDR